MSLMYYFRPVMHRGQMTLVFNLLNESPGATVVFSLPDVSVCGTVTPEIVLFGLSESTQVPIPVRYGQLTSVTRKPSFTEVTATLSEWVVVDDEALWVHSLDTVLDGKTSGCALGPSPQGIRSVNELSISEWSHCVDHLSSSHRFSSSVFWRLLSARIDSVSSQPSITVQSHNPHLSLIENLELHAISALDPALLLMSIPLAYEGCHTKTLDALPKDTDVVLVAAPYRVTSPQKLLNKSVWTHVVHFNDDDSAAFSSKVSDVIETVNEGSREDNNSVGSIIIREPVLGTDIVREKGLDRRGVERLGSTLKRAMESQPEVFLEILDNQLLTAVPDSALLMAAKGTLLCRLGYRREAYEILARIDLVALGDEEAVMAALQSAASVGGVLPYTELIDSINTERADRIDQLRACITAMGEVRGYKLLIELLEGTKMDESTSAALLSQWTDDFNDARSISGVSEYIAIFLGDASAYSYLRDKFRRTPALANEPSLRQALIKYAMAPELALLPDDICDLMKRELCHTVSTGDADSLYRLLGQVQQMRSINGAASVLRETLAEVAITKGHESMALVGHIRSTLAENLLAQGEIDAAIEQLEMARPCVSEGSDLAETLVSLLDRIRDSIDGDEGLRQYKLDKSDQRVDILRGEMAGKGLLIIGGQQQPWLDEVCSKLALSCAEWVKSEKGKQFDTKTLTRLLTGGKYQFFVEITDHLSHTGLDKLEKTAKQQNITVIRCGLGEASLLRELYRNVMGED